MSEKSLYKIYLDASKRREKKVSLVELEGDQENVVAEKKGDIDLVSAIDELLKENKLKLSDINEVVPNKGPGSFTGLKIAVTIANVLNWALGRKTIKELDVPDYGRGPNITLKRF